MGDDILNFFLPENSSLFPPPESADRSGLLAIGSNLRVETLIKAYRHGTFPWYGENEPITWHHPDPRFVLFPSNIHISRSMGKLIERGIFNFKTDTSFREVIQHCRHIVRPKQAVEGSWITNDVEKAYINLFKAGFAHCAEAWREDVLVGGLYGVKLGRVFFGESMFALESNASKFAFIKMVEHLRLQGVALIDCQIYSAHLASLGGGFISRKNFVRLLNQLIP